MKKMIRKGDLIYLDALDRLGRDYDGIIREWKEITRNIGVDIVVLEQEALFDSRKFRTMGDLGKLLEDQFLSLLSYVADQEREKIRQRQREGIDLALSNGTKFGRPRKEITKIFIQTFNDWKKGNITAVKAMQICEMKPSTFYRRVKEYEESIIKLSKL